MIRTHMCVALNAAFLSATSLMQISQEEQEYLSPTTDSPLFA